MYIYVYIYNTINNKKVNNVTNQRMICPLLSARSLVYIYVCICIYVYIYVYICIYIKQHQ